MKTERMRLIEGNQATTRRKFEYRGHFIVSVVRSGDPRNHTHPGYDWEVILANGLRLFVHGRTGAKERINWEVERGNPTQPHPVYDDPKGYYK